MHVRYSRGLGEGCLWR